MSTTPTWYTDKAVDALFKTNTDTLRQEIKASKFLILGASEEVPSGTPVDTLIVRRGQ